ncbi:MULTISPECIES: hypothetical protein [Bacillus]|uniref:hypothetical protein n=1 Tax=Bacillus TaxID=1386 RepID=UPI000BF11EE6|nr:hypothetical protein [Bacillus mycoides]PEK86495.1 hypothetical protein CN600_28885 [Bacillus mycoides]HDR7635526.1 hypothetical protein [Bacillus mycoides]
MSNIDWAAPMGVMSDGEELTIDIGFEGDNEDAESFTLNQDGIVGCDNSFSKEILEKIQNHHLYKNYKYMKSLRLKAIYW